MRTAASSSNNDSLAIPLLLLDDESLSCSSIEFNANGSEKCFGCSLTAIPIRSRVISRPMTTPIDLRQSNKFATLDGDIKALLSLVTIIVVSVDEDDELMYLIEDSNSDDFCMLM